MKHSYPIQFTINGEIHTGIAEARMLLVDYLRTELSLTGTHIGCEHGVCGACTILVDGQAVRSCLMFAVQANGRKIKTVEGLAPSENEMHPIQDAFHEAHGLQCGFCTPGVLMTIEPFLNDNPNPTEEEIREVLSGNICRCTGYQHIVDATLLAAEKLSQ